MWIHEIEQKVQKKFFCFLDNYIWIGSGKFSKFGREYLSWTAIVLRNPPKISHISKTDIFQTSFAKSDGDL